MKVTQQNRRTVKDFLRILVHIGMDDNTAYGIIHMMRDEKDMDEIVDFIEETKMPTPQAVLKKAAEMYAR